MHKYIFFEEYFPDTNVPGPMSNATVSTQSVEILVLAFQKLRLTGNPDKYMTTPCAKC